jgi:hypothetical protein
MLYLTGSVIFIIGSIILMKKFKVNEPFTKGAGLAIVASLLANISLAENISNNLLPERNDGYAISTGIATWILGDDGGLMDRFKQAYVTSMNMTVFLVLSYVVVAIIESKRKGTKGNE